MYEVEETNYGIRVNLSGHMDMEDVESFCEEFESTCEDLSEGWAVFADHRDLSALPDGADQRFAEMMTCAAAQQVGPQAVVVDSAIAAMQQRRMRDEIGIDGAVAVFARLAAPVGRIPAAVTVGNGRRNTALRAGASDQTFTDVCFWSETASTNDQPSELQAGRSPDGRPAAGKVISRQHVNR